MADPEIPVRRMIDRLIAFDTVSRDSNMALIDYVRDYLAGFGVESRLVPNADGTKANLYATVGPMVEGGVVLSGHTDVVPVDGQDWSTDPFTVVERDGKLFGRGTCDMKSFTAIGLALVPEMLAAGLKYPIHFALSYDEEIGCVGAPDMIRQIAANLPRPRAVIVGEPTDMKVVNAHKGICGLEVNVRGHEVHSSQVHRGVSAVMTAARMVTWLEDRMRAGAAVADPANGFEPPFSTLHVGQIRGGTAHNIMARDCWFGVDIRTITEDDPLAHARAFEAWVRAEVEPAMKAIAPDAGVAITMRSHVPGLKPEAGGVAEELAKSLTGENATCVVSYAAEAGQFQDAGFSTIICGPGSIDQAHQPDEFITLEQVAAGTRFLRRLIDRLAV